MCPSSTKSPVKSRIDSIGCRPRLNCSWRRMLEVPAKWAFSMESRLQAQFLPQDSRQRAGRSHWRDPDLSASARGGARFGRNPQEFGQKPASKAASRISDTQEASASGRISSRTLTHTYANCCPNLPRPSPKGERHQAQALDCEVGVRASRGATSGRQPECSRTAETGTWPSACRSVLRATACRCEGSG